MNEPFADAYTAWVGAYLDGEMDEKRSAAMEAHLAQCPRCQEELRSLSALSGLLQMELAETGPLAGAPQQASAPAARSLVEGQSPTVVPGLDGSARPFADGVLRRLPQAQPFDWARAMQAAWRLVPLALFGLWAFLQAVTLVSGLALVSGFPLESRGMFSGDWLFRLPAPLAGGYSDRTLSLAALLAFNLRMTLNLAVLFGGWLAAWVAYQRISVNSLPANGGAVSGRPTPGGTASSGLDH